MKVFVQVATSVLALVTATALVGAQPPAPPLPAAPASPPASPQSAPPPNPVSPTQARFNIATLEAVFETAVQLGAQMLREEVQRVMPADMILLTGAPRARGFRLDGYGVFFDVDVPAISQTIAWTMTKMNQNDAAARNALQQFYRMLPGVNDRRMRDELEWFLRQAAVQMGVPDAATVTTAPGGMPPPGAVVAAGVGPAAQPPVPAAPAGRPAFLDDPVGAYESAVKKAIIDAMLDYSGPLEIGAEEWLTVAARDNEDRRMSPTSPYEVATIVMRIKGSDLVAFRAGRLTRDEAHKRVDVREF